MVTHLQRMETCLGGGQPDRPPVALWRHFPVDDQSAAGLAAAVIDFQRRYDFDLIKVTPASSFALVDWGAADRWTGNPEGTREYTVRVVRKPEDWEKLTVLDPRQGALAQEIEAMRLITAEFAKDTPVLQTVFNPLSIAKNLAGSETLLIHLRRYPEAVRAGLKVISETLAAFMEASIATGIAGFFFAVQHAQYGLLSPAEYQSYGKAYDLPLLEHSARRLWCNMLHLHGKEVFFDLMASYPVQIINWHDRETSPSLSEAQRRFNGAVCGGLRQWDTMVLGAPAQVRSEAENAIIATGGKKFILGTGCVLPTTAPHGNILTARRAVEGELLA